MDVHLWPLINAIVLSISSISRSYKWLNTTTFRTKYSPPCLKFAPIQNQVSHLYSIVVTITNSPSRHVFIVAKVGVKVPSTVDIEGIFPAPKAAAGDGKTSSKIHATRNIDPNGKVWVAIVQF